MGCGYISCPPLRRFAAGFSGFFLVPSLCASALTGWSSLCCTLDGAGGIARAPVKPVRAIAWVTQYRWLGQPGRQPVSSSALAFANRNCLPGLSRLTDLRFLPLWAFVARPRAVFWSEVEPASFGPRLPSSSFFLLSLFRLFSRLPGSTFCMRPFSREVSCEPVCYQTHP